MDSIKILKEIRYYLILIIIIVVLSLFLRWYVVRNIEYTNDLKEKDALIEELRKKLEEKPKAVIKYKDKIKYVEKEPTFKVKELFNLYCEECKKEGISPKLEIENSGIFCEVDICNTDNSYCKMKEVVSEVVEEGFKGTVWQVRAIGGYEFMNKGFMLGVGFIDHKGFEVGADIVSDFSIENSGVGLWVGYKPEFRKWKSNIVFGLGALSHFRDFSSVGLQVFIGFSFLERR